MLDRVNQLYGAVVDTERWSSSLQATAQLLRADGLALLVRDMTGRVTMTLSTDYQRYRPDFEQALVATPGRWWSFPDIASCQMLTAGRAQDNDLHTLCAAVERVSRASAVLVASIPFPTPDAFALVFAGFDRNETAQSAMPTLHALRPSFARAIELSVKMEIARDRFVVETLAHLGVAAAIVDHGRVISAQNSGFTRVTENVAATRQGRFRLSDTASDAELQSLLNDEIDHGSRGHLVVARRGTLHDAVAIDAVRLRSEEAVSGRTKHLLIAVHSSASGGPDEPLLRAMFELTPCEARMTRLLVAGNTLSKAAAMLGITESTARVHLRSIFAKTGASRQAELIGALNAMQVAIVPSVVHGRPSIVQASKAFTNSGTK